MSILVRTKRTGNKVVPVSNSKHYVEIRVNSSKCILKCGIIQSTVGVAVKSVVDSSVVFSAVVSSSEVGLSVVGFVVDGCTMVGSAVVVSDVAGSTADVSEVVGTVVGFTTVISTVEGKEASCISVPSLVFYNKTKIQIKQKNLHTQTKLCGPYSYFISVFQAYHYNTNSLI